MGFMGHISLMGLVSLIGPLAPKIIAKAPDWELLSLVHDCEVVDNAEEVIVLVYYQKRMNLVLVKHVLDLC
jgi:hypothetical protein